MKKVTSINISDLTIVKETEKAIAFLGYVSGLSFGRSSEKSYTVDVWCPKSIIKENELPVWFINKKAAELESRFEQYVDHAHLIISGSCMF